MTRLIEGVLPVLHTPFGADDEIDNECLQREIDWVFETGANGVCSAMVSEILRLTSDERLDLNRRIVQMVAGRGAVIASVGAESTKQALVYARAAAGSGCDAIMAVPPVTTGLPAEAVRGYFCGLADAVDVPLIVQDASLYVGAPLSTEFYVRLLDDYGPEKILFKPEGAPIGTNISCLRDASDGRAHMFDGSGGILLVDAFRRGIAGTIPGVDLLDGIIALWQALNRGDEASAYEIYFPICALVTLQIQAGLDGFLAIEKHLLVKRGIFVNVVRREPHAWTLDVETASEVDRLFDMLQDVLHRGRSQTSDPS